MVKIKKLSKVYDGPPIMLVHLRHLVLKTNGNDQNGKRLKSYGTKLRHFIVRDQNENQK
jgi:hypothetical protein